MSLNYQDVQELLKLLDDSPYYEFTLQTGAFSLQLQRSAEGKAWQQQLKVSEAPAPVQVLAGNQNTNIAEPPATEAGLLEIRAPMVGTWYRAPQPGADPFIEVGSRVKTDTIIGIIEVMKLIGSIPARTAGTVVEILAIDASFIEKGQLLLRVRPD
jgi:acetyl-CoA carboxylase biotin carboxyl carrier protein